MLFARVSDEVYTPMAAIVYARICQHLPFGCGMTSEYWARNVASWTIG